MKFCGLFLLLFSLQTFAHKDVIIRVQSEKLIGLPTEYSPTNYDKKHLKLRIGEMKLEFPECMKPYLLPMFQSNLKISSSWYHDLSSIPKYITFKNLESETDSLILNLDTLEPIITFSSYGNTEEQKACISNFIIQRVSENGV
ncbi:hypothetical protein [Paraglaciecola sp. 25GB23A]|uniref:hypothetical protein n=1 Tax=Paraglaciecola sp. 25GB23A TaxID=3156068 RepID=UPI0032AF3CC5